MGIAEGRGSGGEEGSYQILEAVRGVVVVACAVEAELSAVGDHELVVGVYCVV
jgi:hypothetical protein